MTSGYDSQTAARLATAGEEAVVAFARRAEPTGGLAAQADAVAQACHAMAVRFHQGGKLVVFGTGASSTDAQHVAVEFVHPVIVATSVVSEMAGSARLPTMTGCTNSTATCCASVLAAPVPNTTSLPP